VLDDYAAANSLQIDSSSVKLDKLMVSNLFNKKEPQMEGDTCPLEEVVKRLLGKLQLFHKITRVTEQVRGLSCLVLHFQDPSNSQGSYAGRSIWIVFASVVLDSVN